jgi:cytochrome P450
VENRQLLLNLLEQPDRFLESVRRYTTSITTSITYGWRTVSHDDHRMAALFEGAQAFAEIVMSVSTLLLDTVTVLRRLPDFLVPVKRRARNLHLKEKELFLGHWLAVKSAVRDGTAKPCFSVGLAKMQQQEGFSDERAAYVAGTLLEAGADTTSNTFYGFIQAMLLFPDIQRQLQASIDGVVSNDRLPSMDDYQRLPYVRCCIKESLRWMPTAIFGFPHAVTQENFYQGYRIPRGATVIINAYAIQMDPHRHAHPRRFDPDRYKTDYLSLAESAASPDVTKRDHFQFGGGRRVCPGMHIVERTLFLGYARLMWAFDVLPMVDEQGKHILPDPERLTQGLATMPQPFSAMIRPRSERRANAVRQAWREAQGNLDAKTGQWKNVPSEVWSETWS